MPVLKEKHIPDKLGTTDSDKHKSSSEFKNEQTVKIEAKKETGVEEQPKQEKKQAEEKYGKDSKHEFAKEKQEGNQSKEKQKQEEKKKENKGDVKKESKKSEEKAESNTNKEEKTPNVAPTIDYSQLEQFPDKILGEGAFGEVYQGLYFKIPVAIKRLKKSQLGAKGMVEFKNEVQLLSYIFVFFLF